MKIGVILARFQPIHNGHIALIDHACNNNDEVYVFIGSADKLNERNPIPIALREQMVRNSLSKYDKVKIFTLNDLSSEGNDSYEWGFYLYSHIVEQTKNPSFTIYYSDGYQIITRWFPPFMFSKFISMNLFARNGVENNISATEVRNKIMNDGDLEKCVPQSVIDNQKIIKEFIKIQENGK